MVAVVLLYVSAQGYPVWATLVRTDEPPRLLAMLLLLTVVGAVPPALDVRRIAHEQRRLELLSGAIEGLLLDFGLTEPRAIREPGGYRLAWVEHPLALEIRVAGDTNEVAASLVTVPPGFALAESTRDAWAGFERTDILADVERERGVPLEGRIAWTSSRDPRETLAIRGTSPGDAAANVLRLAVPRWKAARAPVA